MIELPKCTVGDIGKPEPAAPEPMKIVVQMPANEPGLKRGDHVRVKRFGKPPTYWTEEQRNFMGWVGQIMDVLGDGYRLDNCPYHLVWAGSDLEKC